MDILRRITDYVEDPGDHAGSMATGQERLRRHIEQATQHAKATTVDNDGHDVSSPASTVNRLFGGRLGRRWAAGAAAALAVAAFALVVLPSEEVTALGNLAEAVQTLPNEAFHDANVERHATIRALTHLSGDLPAPLNGDIAVIVTTEETRRTSDDDLVQVTQTITDIEFLTDLSPDEQTVVSDLVGVGTTETWTYPLDDAHYGGRAKLSEDPAILERNLRRDIKRWGDPDVPDGAEMLIEIIELHRTYLLTPAERSATLHVLAGLPELAATADGRSVHVQAEYESPNGREQLAATFDNNGWLVTEAHVYADGLSPYSDGPVADLDAAYQPPVVIQRGS